MKRFLRDESGVTMALAVIMIVLISVMGAGLLVFVRNDLGVVVEVNRGQQALEMADAGIEAARGHLSTVDARPSSYDDDLTNGNSEWSDDGSPKALDFDGDGNNEISVAIQYLSPSANLSDAYLPNNAPEALPPDDGNPATIPAYPNNRNYFKVTVQGRSGNVLRQVQAIYRTENFDLPVAFYATRNISLGGSTTINGISLFANCYIVGLRAEHLALDDQAYGNWATNPTTGNPNEYNSVPRNSRTAGAAALGEGTGCAAPPAGGAASGIDYDPTGNPEGNTRQKNGTANPQRYGALDFDRNSNIAVGTPPRNFRKNTWGTPASPTSGQPTNTITFPFKTDDAAADADLISALKQKARQQDNYIRRPSGTSFDIDDGTGPDDYPSPGTLDTVYFVEFAEGTDDNPVYGAKGTADYLADTTEADGKVKGTLVIVNGDLEFQVNSADDFQGVVVVRDRVAAGNATLEPEVTRFNKSGNIQLEGFASVEGDIFLSGTVDGILPGALVNGIPGLFKVNLWSWRECYNTACN